MLSQKKIFICVLFLLSIALYSQNFLILDVQVQGNSRINRDLILATSNLRIGDTFSPDGISHAIRALYNLSVFNDVNITLEEINRGLRINIIVEELPIVNRITYVGNKAISKNKIEEIGIVRLGTYWSPIIQSENTRRLLSEYISKGYNLVQIDYIVRQTTDGVDIRVVINEGKRLVVREIVIHGNSEIESKRILKTMDTKRKSFFRSGRWEKEKFDEDLKSIVDYYQNQGFIDARIVHTDETINDDRFLSLNVYIEEGDRFYFGSISVTGNYHFESKRILDNFTMRENDIFNMERFNKQLQSVASMYFEEGYIYSNYDPQITRVTGSASDVTNRLSSSASASISKVNINLVIVENTRAKIHKIHISGNMRTKEKVIRRQLVIAPGDYFRQSRVIRSQQNIYNLGFFDPDFGLDYQPINTLGDVDLFLNVVDKTVGSVNGGAGFNSRDGVVFHASVAHNNLLGNNWQGNVSVEYSKSNQNIDMSFTNPHFYDTDVLFGFNLYHTQRDWIDFNYRVFINGGGVRLGYPIKVLDHSRAILGYSLYSKKYELRHMSGWDDASDNLKRLHEASWQYTSSVNLTLRRDSRDNIFFPTTGSKIDIYNEIAGGLFGGDFNYFKQIAEVSWYTPAFLTTVLRTKWRYGYITGYGNSENEIPPDERFYLGGTGPDGIRGYSDRSIPNDREGGARMVLFSTELGVPITSDQIVGLLFLDSGNSYNRFSDFNFRDFRTGAGIGIRLRTPFGLLGFDYAHNFEQKRWEPHFQFGTLF